MKINRDDDTEGKVHWVLVKLGELGEDRYAVDCPTYSAGAVRRRLLDDTEKIEWGEPKWARVKEGTLIECLDFLRFIYEPTGDFEEL